jgi:PTS system fructose-specific IIA component
MVLLDERHVFIDEKLATKEEAIIFLGEKAVLLGLANDKQTIIDSFLAREGESTTGMMDGFAIPHAKNSAIERAGVFIIRLSSEIDWDSLDGKPTMVLIAMLIPEQEAGTTHLKILSQIARLLMKNEFKDNLQTLPTAEAIANYVMQKIEA